MRPTVIAVGLFLVAQSMAAPPGVAQEASEPQRLLRIIEEQQRRLDAQEAQLTEQKNALQELRKQVEALHAAGRPPASAPPTATADVSTRPSKSGLEVAKAPALAVHEEWPGSFGVSGIDTRFKISGFAEIDILYDNDAIATPSAFVTSAILTRNATAAQGTAGQTNFSVQPTRLALETRTQLRDHRLRAFVSADFFKDFGSTSPELRLRQAFGEVNDILFGGDLLLGQEWSTFTNLDAIPNTLDFEGPNALVGIRHPMVRWTRPVGPGLKLKLAVEAPDQRYFEKQSGRATAVSTSPDGVVVLGWVTDSFNLQGSFLARDLRASGDDRSVASAFGWGVSLAGRMNMPGALDQDFAAFALTYGEGIGGVLNDGPPDASYDPTTNELKAIPTLAWYASYQHWWNPKLYSVFSYGYLRQSNQDFQLPLAFRKTQYSSANLTWTPYPQWLFGVEALYGTREDKDGSTGSDFRTLFVSRFLF